MSRSINAAARLNSACTSAPAIIAMPVTIRASSGKVSADADIGASAKMPILKLFLYINLVLSNFLFFLAYLTRRATHK